LRRSAARDEVIGFLGIGSPGVFAYIVRAFRRGLSETGFVKDRNVAIEYSSGQMTNWIDCRRWRPIWSVGK
jgi:hypothetical protein